MVITISRLLILRMIGDELGNIVNEIKHKPQYLGAIENIARSYQKAEAMIEVLEVSDCGKIGGFDEDQPCPANIFYRWEWLYRKYNIPDDKRFTCDIVSYDEIETFFRR